MSVVGKSYLISLVKGRSDLLRISEELAKDLNDLGIHGAITCTCSKPDGRKLPVRIDAEDRTVVGLGSWLKEPKDEDVKSVRLEGKSDTPCSFAVDFSKESAHPVGGTEPIKIHRPEQGLYLGGKLSSQFYELIRTNEPVAINESDLLQHAFICGATGYGKTILAKVFIEEAALKGIPVIAIDLKGDISSMAILSSGEDPAELIPWVAPQREESREAKAATVAEQHNASLERWGLSHKDVEDFEKKVAVNVFTPRSNAGFRLSLSAFGERPEDAKKLKEKDPDSYRSAIDFMADTFVSRLNLNKRKAEKARGYVYEIIKTCWDSGESLRGYNGIKQVLDEVMSGQLGIEQIGGMATNEYISQKDRVEIADAINALLISGQELWFQGFPLNIEELINPNNYDGKTPLTIINIQHLNFKDKAYVVGYVAYLIWSWMQRWGGVDYPKLIFYIDEIGGGVSKEAFFHSVAISPCKNALTLLLRQGRGYGVCCIFATQEPGDIDYKGLGQCGTEAIGKLTTKRGRQKVEEGAGADLDFEQLSQHIPKLSTGRFLLRTPSLPWTMFDGRWVMHPIHRSLAREDIERLKENYEKEVYTLFEEAQKCANSKDGLTAKNLLESIISSYRFSALCPKAYLLLGKVLYDMSDYENAIKKLEDMIKRRMEAEETGEAYFLIGKCKEQQGRFDDAAIDFVKVASSAANEETKSIAFSHEHYCKSRTIWPELTEIQKLFWWIVGRKPDDAALIRLESKDKDLLEERFTTQLQEQDFSIPELIDFSQLFDASKKAAIEQRDKAAEQVKAEQWASEQIPKIEAYLEEGHLEEASKKCNNIIQRLNDTEGRLTDSLKIVLERYNNCVTNKSQASRNKLLMYEARQFEFEITNLFRHKGYKAFATSFTNDDGVDVFAFNDNEKVIIQCKRWKHPVGRDKIDELANVKRRKNAHRAILATTSTFSEDAKRFAHEQNIELWDFHRISREWHDVLIMPTALQ